MCVSYIYVCHICLCFQGLFIFLFIFFTMGVMAIMAPGLFCVCCLTWKWLLAFCLVLAFPRLLWQPGLGQPAEGAKYVYGLGFWV